MKFMQKKHFRRTGKDRQNSNKDKSTEWRKQTDRQAVIVREFQSYALHLVKAIEWTEKGFPGGSASKPCKRDEEKGILKKSESQDANEFPDEQGKELKLPVAWEKFQK